MANIALHGLENLIHDKFPATNSGYLRNSKSQFGYRVTQPKVIRYADDFVVMNEELPIILQCQKLITEWLESLGLELKPSKTQIVHSRFSHEGKKPGFNFLGFNIRQYNVGRHSSGKRGNQHKSEIQGYRTWIKPNPEKVKEHYRELARVIGKFNGDSTIKMIETLNSKIRGWCNYYTPWNSKETFDRLKSLMFIRLRRWSKRRHRNKNSTWRNKKYWRSVGGDNWVFSYQSSNGTILKLLKHSSFPAGTGHIKVKGNRSPFDGDEVYWGKRLGDKYKYLKPQVARLLKRQKGKCNHCGKSFKTGDNLEKHHIQFKSEGGKQSDKNLVLLHLHCHDQIHRQQ